LDDFAGECDGAAWLARIFHYSYIRWVATTFEVLAEPTRRRILDLLLEQPRSVGELVDRLGLSQPGTSKHLRVLRDAGLVHVRREAQRRWYELRPEPLTEIDAWLAPYRQLWATRLDALERHLDAMPDPPAARGADAR
jgi:DNA-binding transcriptional ArsR family regulator